MKLFTDTQLTTALNAYGTSASAHVSRLIALADMRETEGATLEDIAWAVRYAAACADLGLPYDDPKASTRRAAERMPGFSESTFQRYNVVLEWLSSSLGDDEKLSDILAADAFSADALSALSQLATGKVATRKQASDVVAGHIVKRDSEKIVAAYRRLLAASNAKKKSQKERAARVEESKTDTAPAPERSPEEILSDLTIPAMAELLMARVASSADDLSADDYAALVDTLTAISAMLEESADD